MEDKRKTALQKENVTGKGKTVKYINEKENKETRKQGKGSIINERKKKEKIEIKKIESGRKQTRSNGRESNK